MAGQQRPVNVPVRMASGSPLAVASEWMSRHERPAHRARATSSILASIQSGQCGVVPAFDLTRNGVVDREAESRHGENPCCTLRENFTRRGYRLAVDAQMKARAIARNRRSEMIHLRHAANVAAARVD